MVSNIYLIIDSKNSPFEKFPHDNQNNNENNIIKLQSDNDKIEKENEQKEEQKESKKKYDFANGSYTNVDISKFKELDDILDGK